MRTVDNAGEFFVEHSLGKGEVVSSILTGSTRYHRNKGIFDLPTAARNEARTRRFDSWKIRGCLLSNQQSLNSQST
jgi:hypothetical protein